MKSLTAILQRAWARYVKNPPSDGTDGGFSALPFAARVYVVVVIITGATIAARNLPHGFEYPWITVSLLLISVAMANFKIPLPLADSRATMSLGHAPDFASLLLLGPDVAMVLGTTSAWYQCTFRRRISQPFYRTLFSMASIAITVQAAGFVFTYAGGMPGSLRLETATQGLASAAVAYYAVNTVLVAWAIALSTQTPFHQVWQRDFLWSAPGYFFSAAAAGGSALAYEYGKLWTLPLAALPLYLTYKSYATYMGRLEDQERHAKELAALHNATLEALERATLSERALAAEKAQLALEKERLFVTVGNIRDGVVTTDVNGSVVLMNQAAEQLMATAVGAETGKNVTELLERLALEPRPKFREAVEAVLRGGEAVRLVDRATLTLADGIVKRIDATGAPMRDRGGEVVGAVFVLRDVTDATHLEQERARGTQLESLGVLAGGLAHDFNNLLTGIVGNISLARFNDSPEDVSERLEEAERACQRARAITNQLLTFSNGGAPVKTTSWLGDLVKDTTTFALTGSPVAPRFVIPMDLAPVEIDIGQISQVMHNLVLNAQQATPGAGTVSVTLENVAFSHDEWRDGVRIRAGRYVSLAVQDHGIGISPENMRRLFDPYFTTKKTGTGLGLAVCYSIVTAHGGFMTVKSELGKGACFTLYLPASTRRPATKVAATPRERLSAGGRVLIMDDERTIRDVACRMFKKLGYDPAVAANGEEAIQLVKEAIDNKRRFEIVVMDLTVPGAMGGKDAVPLIKKIDPTIKAIVSSGYADDPVMANHAEYGFDGVMGKPYVIADMREALGVLAGDAKEEAVAVAS
jgi:PAS domain S-box-containing protein